MQKGGYAGLTQQPKVKIMNIEKTKANADILNLAFQMKDVDGIYLVVRGKKLFIVNDKNLLETDVEIQPEEVIWC